MESENEYLENKVEINLYLLINQLAQEQAQGIGHQKLFDMIVNLAQENNKRIFSK